MIPECKAIPQSSVFYRSYWMEDGEEKKGETQSQTSRINETVTLISVPEEGPNTAWCGLERMGFLRDLLNKSHLSGVLVYTAST